MSADDARRAILARRARFLAATALGLGVAACADRWLPAPCLKVSTPTFDGGPEPAESGDGGLDASAAHPDAAKIGASSPSAGLTAVADAGTPQPCLKIAPDPDHAK